MESADIVKNKKAKKLNEPYRSSRLPGKKIKKRHTALYT
jgi:hypothetical protein